MFSSLEHLARGIARIEQVPEAWLQQSVDFFCEPQECSDRLHQAASLSQSLRHHFSRRLVASLWLGPVCARGSAGGPLLNIKMSTLSTCTVGHTTCCLVLKSFAAVDGLSSEAPENQAASCTLSMTGRLLLNLELFSLHL